MIDLTLWGFIGVSWVVIHIYVVAIRHGINVRDNARHKRMQRSIENESKFKRLVVPTRRGGYLYEIREIDNIATYKYRAEKWSDNSVEIIRK